MFFLTLTIHPTHGHPLFIWPSIVLSIIYIFIPSFLVFVANICCASIELVAICFTEHCTVYRSLTLVHKIHWILLQSHIIFSLRSISTVKSTLFIIRIIIIILFIYYMLFLQRQGAHSLLQASMVTNYVQKHCYKNIVAKQYYSYRTLTWHNKNTHSSNNTADKGLRKTNNVQRINSSS